MIRACSCPLGRALILPSCLFRLFQAAVHWLAGPPQASLIIVICSSRSDVLALPFAGLPNTFWLRITHTQYFSIEPLSMSDTPYQGNSRARALS